jgi:hypothetical protein
MALLEKYSILLRWWLFFAVASLGTVALSLSGVIQKVNQADFTKISFLIYAVFAIRWRFLCQASYKKSTRRILPKSVFSSMQFLQYARA